MSEGTITTKLRLNVTPFVRAMRDATESFRGLGYAASKQPRPPRRPYPRRHSLMTAREYRASRRAYARALRAHRKATR
jgi:hypothetical protein